MLPFKKSVAIKDEVVTEISGNRRSKQRFSLDHHMTYKIMKNYLVTATGTGQTVDMSSGGVAFTTNQTFKIGTHIELTVSWPVLLNGDCPIKLVIHGRVVRSTGQSTAIRIDRQEFRAQAQSRIQVQPAPTMAA